MLELYATLCSRYSIEIRAKLNLILVFQVPGGYIKFGLGQDMDEQAQ